MRLRVSKWGNSAGIILPAALLSAVKIQQGEEVEVNVNAGKLVIEPLESIEFSLDDLVSGITPDNKHNEISFGPAIGKEAI